VHVTGSGQGIFLKQFYQHIVLPAKLSIYSWMFAHFRLCLLTLTVGSVVRSNDAHAPYAALVVPCSQFALSQNLRGAGSASDEQVLHLANDLPAGPDKSARAAAAMAAALGDSWSNIDPIVRDYVCNVLAHAQTGLLLLRPCKLHNPSSFSVTLE